MGKVYKTSLQAGVSKITIIRLDVFNGLFGTVFGTAETLPKSYKIVGYSRGTLNENLFVINFDRDVSQVPWHPERAK